MLWQLFFGRVTWGRLSQSTVKGRFDRFRLIESYLKVFFHRKLRTLEKCLNVKKLRTTEPQPIFTDSDKKKVYQDDMVIRLVIIKFRIVIGQNGF